MPMMDIRVMGMLVGELRMEVLMSMRLSTIPVKIMGMLVMFIMCVGVTVRQRIMGMSVRMLLCQM